ncbi:MAG: hypothetical protein KC649_04930, partial [Candidatus Omnitrophica bacterium]|nr:hypothetical protein [Candidatus Omnitrophota bacterium]
SEKFKAKLAGADNGSRLKKNWKSEWGRHLNLEMRKQGILWNPQQITGAEKKILEEAERGIEIAAGRRSADRNATVATKSALSGISVAASRLAIEGAKVKRTGVGEYQVVLPVYEVSDRPSEDVSIEESLEQLRQVYADRIEEAIQSYTIQDVRSNNVQTSVEENVRAFISSNFPSMSASEVESLLNRPDVRTALNEKIAELERLDVADFMGVSLDELMIPAQDGQVDTDKQVPVRRQSERKKPSIWTWSYWSNLLGLKAPARARRSSYSYSSRIAAVEVLPPRTMLTATGLVDFNVADNLDVLHNDTSTQVEVRYVDTQSFEFADNSKLTPDDRVVIQVDKPDGSTRTLSETSADNFFAESGGYAKYTFDLTPELGQEVSLSVSVKDGEDGSDVTPPTTIGSGIRVDHTGPTLPATSQIFNKTDFEIAHYDNSNDIGIFVDNSGIEDDIDQIARSIAANDAGLGEKSNEDLVDQTFEQAGLRFFAAPDGSQDPVGPQIVIPLGDAKTAHDAGADTMLVTLSDLPVTGQPYDVYVQLVGEGLSGDQSVLQIADNVAVTTDEASIRSFPDAPGTFRVSANPETAGSFVISTNADEVTAFTANSSKMPDQATPNAAVRFVITDFAAPDESPVQTLTELAVVPVSDFQGSTGIVNSAAYYPDLSGTYTISAQMVAPGWKSSEPQIVSSVTVRASFVDIFQEGVANSSNSVQLNQLMIDVYDIDFLRPSGLTSNEISRIQPKGNGTGPISDPAILYIDAGDPSVSIRFFESYLNMQNVVRNQPADVQQVISDIFGVDFTQPV